MDSIHLNNNLVGLETEVTHTDVSLKLLVVDNEFYINFAKRNNTFHTRLKRN